jgi:hypothetical protein
VLCCVYNSFEEEESLFEWFDTLRSIFLYNNFRKVRMFDYEREREREREREKGFVFHFIWVHFVFVLYLWFCELMWWWMRPLLTIERLHPINSCSYEYYCYYYMEGDVRLTWVESLVRRSKIWVGSCSRVREASLINAARCSLVNLISWVNRKLFFCFFSVEKSECGGVVAVSICCVAEDYVPPTHTPTNNTKSDFFEKALITIITMNVKD